MTAEKERRCKSQMLADKLQEEYQAGNYVIAGGDFNQTFEGVDKYEIHDTDSWVPGTVYKEDLPDGFDLLWQIISSRACCVC